MQHLVPLLHRCRLPALVDPFGLRQGDSFRLTLQHDFPLERGDGPDHGQHQFARWCRRVDAQILDLQCYPFGVQLVCDLQQEPSLPNISTGLMPSIQAKEKGAQM